MIANRRTETPQFRDSGRARAPPGRPAASRPIGEQAPAKTTGGGGQTVSSISLSEYKFDPTDVTAKAGSTITLKNQGSLGHDLRLRKSGKEVGGTKVFGAGKSEQFKVDFAPGKYEMFCSVPGHEQQGVKGSFTIR